MNGHPPAGLTPTARALLEEARRAVLGTVTGEGRARLVPVCFWLADAADAADGAGPMRVYTALDEKLKQDPDPRRLARVRDLLARPAVTLLVDRWEEDWRRLAWVRLDGTARLLEPAGPDRAAADEHATAAAGLRARYPQYRDHDLASRPVIRITVERVTAWSAA